MTLRTIIKRNLTVQKLIKKDESNKDIKKDHLKMITVLFVRITEVKHVTYTRKYDFWSQKYRINYSNCLIRFL